MLRRIVLIAGTVLTALIASALIASAANTAAQIVTCSTATACYSPDPIRVTTGTTITWSNGTSLAHTATADSGAWDTGAIATGATSSSIVFNTPGTFAYHCRFHSDMHGSIIVTAAVSPTPAATTAPTMRPNPRRTTRVLAPSGSGPAAVLGALALLLGLLVLSSGRLPRQSSKSQTKPVHQPR